MKNKDFVLVYLFVVCAVLLFTTFYFYDKAEVKIVEKKEPTMKINYDIESVRKWMLRVGVSGAFVENVGDKKADCFVTTMFSNGSALSYCELRR